MALVYRLASGLPPMAVLGSQGEGEAQSPDVWGRTRAMPLCTFLGPEKVTRPGQIQAWVGGGVRPHLHGRKCRVTWQRTSMLAKGSEITADTFAHDLARSHQTLNS